MHASDKMRPVQCSTVSRWTQTMDAWHFFNLLTDSELLEPTEQLLPGHRERLFPPTETLSMFMAQALSADRSCQAVVNDSAVKRMSDGLPACSTYTGAYCKARQRLPVAMVNSLKCYTGLWIDAQVPDTWRWQGRRVVLVDGTTVTLADTPADQAAYPQQRGQAAGLGFPIARIVGLTCLSSGALLNAAIGPFKGKGSSEQALLRSLLDTLSPDDILLGDALYGTYFLLTDLLDQNVDALFEQHGSRRCSTDFRRGKRLGSKDHLITLQKPKQRPAWMTQQLCQAAPAHITVRELRVGGHTLVTTLLCPRMTPKSALKALYKSRWHVELDIRQIKTTLGMKALRCKTPQMAEKELWVHLLAYNLIRMLMVQSACMADVLPRMLSFKHTVQLWLAWTRGITAIADGVACTELLVLIAEQRVGQRPGRIEPRAVKRRHRIYPVLVEPRPQAQARVRKYGHPKKVK